VKALTDNDLISLDLVLFISFFSSVQMEYFAKLSLKKSCHISLYDIKAFNAAIFTVSDFSSKQDTISGIEYNDQIRASDFNNFLLSSGNLSFLSMYHNIIEDHLCHLWVKTSIASILFQILVAASAFRLDIAVYLLFNLFNTKIIITMSIIINTDNML